MDILMINVQISQVSKERNNIKTQLNRARNQANASGGGMLGSMLSVSYRKKAKELQQKYNIKTQQLQQLVMTRQMLIQSHTMKAMMTMGMMGQMMNGGGFPSQLPPLNGGMFPQGAYMPQTRLSLPMPPGVMLSANQPSTSEIGSQILGGVGGAAGSIAGGVGGAVTGAAIGTAVFPGVGTVVGGILGALGGSKIGEAVGGFIGNVGGGLIGGAIDGVKNFFKSIF